MTRARMVLVALASALAAACAAPTIDDSLDDEIVVPKRVSSGASEDDSEGTKVPGPGDPNGGGTAKSAETNGAPAGSSTTSTPPPPPPPVGKWMQANGEECVAFCAANGKTNVASSDGAKCTSGENIPASAIAGGITYDKCFPNCNAHTSGQNPISKGKYCYASGQKQDNDSSDITRGCFCL